MLEVSDTGCGMDEQTRLHAFEPFFTTKPQGKGTGLVLSTVYGIVHQFGGCIHLESQPAIGSSFQLFFPVTDPPLVSEASQPEGIPMPVESQPLTILLARPAPGASLISQVCRPRGSRYALSLGVLELARQHTVDAQIP